MLCKKLKKGSALLCAVFLIGAAGCTANPAEESKTNRTGTPAVEKQGSSTEGTAGQTAEKAAPRPEVSEAITAVRQSEVTESAERTATVKFSDAGMEITGSGCEADGNLLKIKEAGTYEIRGTLSNGSICVNVDNDSEVHLILNGVTIHNETGAALYCKKAARVTVTLAEGSVNTLSDGASYRFAEGEDEPDATLFAKHDLVLNGKGKLTVTSAYADAIKGKDCVYLLEGELTVNSADDGIVGRDLLYIADGSVTVNAAADALKSTNDTDAALGDIVIDGGTLSLTAGTDGIQAENALTINAGTFTIKTGGGSANASMKTDSKDGGFGKQWGMWGNPGGFAKEETTQDTSSAKGLKAGTMLAVNGGSFDLDTSDDALHSNAAMHLGGGELLISSGDDGMHADETITIAGDSKIKVTKSYEGMEALEIMISGGEIDIVASDDGLNAAGGADGSAFGRPGAGRFGEGEGEVTIADGTLTVDAAGDGLDSNGNLTVSGGTVLVFGPTNGGNGVLDYGGSFYLNGGTLLCVGSSEMAQTPANTSGQYSLAAVITSAVQAGSTVEIVVDGETVISEEVPKPFNYIVASSKEFAADAEVAVVINGRESYAGTLTEAVTCFGALDGMGGFGGAGGFEGNQGKESGKQDGGKFPWSEGEMPKPPNGEMPEGGAPAFPGRGGEM